LRAYRRMSGDESYRAVLADCERALGRPEVALRLVAEALADGPDAAETAELRIVESGARLDLGEDAAARLVLEAALGNPLDPTSLQPGDAPRLRLASAYADLLESEQENDRAMDWLVAIAAADPEDVTGAVDRLGIEFTDLEDDVDTAERTNDPEDEPDVDTAAAEPHPSGDAAPPEVVELLPEDDHGLGRSFDEDIEAEVAELLGEVDPPSAEDSPADGADEH
jgi:hypothetical protein